MAFSNKPIRRSALIGPWGVGAIVPFPNDESLMIAGLDMWRYNNATPFLIEDERLQKRLGVFFPRILCIIIPFTYAGYFDQ